MVSPTSWCQASKSKPKKVRMVFNYSTNYGGPWINFNILLGPHLTSHTDEAHKLRSGFYGWRGSYVLSG